MRQLTERETRELRTRNDELERERDRLDGELREERERRDREWDKAEATRKEWRAAMHPSNRLYRGEITNAVEALEAHIAALESENHGWTDADDNPDLAMAERWERYINVAKRCLAEYRAKIETEEAVLFGRWALDSDTKEIGEAGLARDWSRLAI